VCVCLFFHVNSPSVQSLSRVLLFATPWTAACQASLSNTNSRSPPKLMSIESVMSSNHLILCRPLLLLQGIFPTQESNPGLLHCRQIISRLSYEGSPNYWAGGGGVLMKGESLSKRGKHRIQRTGGATQGTWRECPGGKWDRPGWCAQAQLDRSSRGDASDVP